MGWGRMLLLGDFGQQLDIQDQRRELQDARSRMAAQSYKDRSQDEQIARLEKDNADLRLYLFGLLRLLQSKGTITAQEVSDLVGGIEPDEPK